MLFFLVLYRLLPPFPFSDSLLTSFTVLAALDSDPVFASLVNGSFEAVLILTLLLGLSVGLKGRVSVNADGAISSVMSNTSVVVLN